MQRETKPPGMIAFLARITDRAFATPRDGRRRRGGYREERTACAGGFGANRHNKTPPLGDRFLCATLCLLVFISPTSAREHALATMTPAASRDVAFRLLAPSFISFHRRSALISQRASILNKRNI